MGFHTVFRNLDESNMAVRMTAPAAWSRLKETGKTAISRRHEHSQWMDDTVSVFTAATLPTAILFKVSLNDILGEHSLCVKE